MHINKLPDVVLARIFCLICKDSDYELNLRYSIVEWRSKLALLSVCRIWRELALPSVHRTSFVRCSPINLPKKRKNKGQHNIYDSKPSDNLGDKMYVVKSSLDIIGNTGSRIWPRTIQLFVKTPSNPIYGLQGIIEKMRNHTILLEKVMRMELNYEKAACLQINVTANVAEVSFISESFFQLVPHVHYFKHVDNDASNTFINFAQSLVKGYAHQLTGFKCPQFVLGKAHGFSDNLRYIDLSSRRITQHMPQICAENLTHLSLNYMNSEFNWSSFESSGISRSLNFANLKQLQLSFSFMETDDDWETSEVEYLVYEFNYKVTAPKLETVILRLCTLTLSVLSSIYGLATIPNVELKLYSGTISFTDFALDIARDKFASYAENSQDGSRAIDEDAYMNNTFNIHGLAKSSDAKILRNGYPLDFEDIDWKYLSNIEMHCLFHVNDLKTLVSKAPSLETIYVNEVDIKEDGKLLPEIQDEATTVVPISSCLKSFSFGCLTGCIESEEDKFMIYLRKLIPTD